MTQPSIRGPASISRSAVGPVTFTIDPGSNRFYGVEVATQPALFDPLKAGKNRSNHNFYASWRHSELMSSSTFVLPKAVWQQLKGAHQLYYRAVTSQITTDWVNYIPTTRDDELLELPFIQIVDLFLTGLPAETTERIEAIWTAAAQRPAIQHVMTIGEYALSVHWHNFSPQRPFDTRTVELVVVASSFPQHEDAPVHIGLLRLEYLTLAVIGEHIFRDPQQPTSRREAQLLFSDIQDFSTDQAAVERQGELWGLSALRPSPTHRGGTALLHARTRTIVYLATTQWEGQAQVLIPSR